MSTRSCAYTLQVRRPPPHTRLPNQALLDPPSNPPLIWQVNAEDYDAMPDDFVNLGFTPPDQLERVRASNLTEGLSFVLRQLSQGGGGKKLQVQEWW